MQKKMIAMQKMTVMQKKSEARKCYANKNNHNVKKKQEFNDCHTKK